MRVPEIAARVANAAVARATLTIATCGGLNPKFETPITPIPKLLEKHTPRHYRLIRQLGTQALSATMIAVWVLSTPHHSKPRNMRFSSSCGRFGYFRVFLAKSVAQHTLTSAQFVPGLPPHRRRARLRGSSPSPVEVADQKQSSRELARLEFRRPPPCLAK